MSSQKKGRPGVQEGQLVQMLECKMVQQAAADAAKKLADATKEAEQTATAALAAAALSAPEELFARFCSNGVGGRVCCT
jgi:hypothetical protein